MKKFVRILMLSVLFTFCFTATNAVPKFPSENQISKASTIGIEHFENITAEEFLLLTPRKIKEQTGQKLSIKQAIALKAAQKKIKSQLKKGKMAGDDQLVALILVIMFGLIGIHRFYLGYTGIGIVQLLTLGMCGIWTLVDLVMIITGDLQPKNGFYEETL